MWALSAHSLIEYAPDQPRWPGGDPRGGRFKAVAAHEERAPGVAPPPRAVQHMRRLRAVLLRAGVIVPPVAMRAASHGFIAKKAGDGAAAYAVPGEIVVSFDSVAALADNEAVARAPRTSNHSVDMGATRLLVHELLHQAQGVGAQAMDPLGFEAMRTTEEGAVEAVAIDITEQFWRTALRDKSVFFGRPDVYKDEVVEVRRRSARATGSKWTSPKARAWRIRFVMATPAERERMWSSGA